MEEMVKNDHFFNDRFLDALRSYPSLHHLDFQVLISIGINHRGVIEVEAVVLEGLGKKPKNSEQEPTGTIVLAFEVRNWGSKVCFEVERSVPLDEEEVRRIRGGYGMLDNPRANGAYIIADALSDQEPVQSFGWTVTSEIRGKILRPWDV